jgi:hypothetical protein
MKEPTSPSPNAQARQGFPGYKFSLFSLSLFRHPFFRFGKKVGLIGTRNKLFLLSVRIPLNMVFQLHRVRTRTGVGIPYKMCRAAQANADRTASAIMYAKPALQIVGNACVEAPVRAAQDIYEIGHIHARKLSTRVRDAKTKSGACPLFALKNI